MNNTPTFAVLRGLLVQVGFAETVVPGSQVVFEHATSGTVLAYRPYAVDEPVSAGDLAKTRKFLDERGILSPEEFQTRWHGTLPK